MPIEVPDLSDVIAAEPHEVLFATVSGAHLYGFPSQDSDVDLRGVHLLHVREVLGLQTGEQTLERMWLRDEVELDLVTHDLLKFCRLLLRPNGYVLEQLLSPLVVHSTGAHRTMIELAPGCVTAHHAHHYRGFATTQWRLFEKSGELKPLLYTFRALLTGIHLMRTGEVIAHLPSLLAGEPLAGVLTDLIEAKRAGEHDKLAATASAPTVDTLADAVQRLHEELAKAQLDTTLPDQPTAGPPLQELIISLRLATETQAAPPHRESSDIRDH